MVSRLDSEGRGRGGQGQDSKELHFDSEYGQMVQIYTRQ